MIILVALSWTVTSAQRNECELGLHTCDVDTQNCYNTQSTFLCLCKSGFVFSAGECHDIDECDLDSFLCPPLSGCVNSPGSYECRCVTGYELRGEACVDVDECMFEPCHEKATCTNLDGSFTCTCDEYYAGSGDEFDQFRKRESSHFEQEIKTNPKKDYRVRKLTSARQIFTTVMPTLCVPT